MPYSAEMRLDRDGNIIPVMRAPRCNPKDKQLCVRSGSDRVVLIAVPNTGLQVNRVVPSAFLERRFEVYTPK